MKNPLPRFTIRRLMLAVAIVAALLWSSMMTMRSLEYWRLAIHHEEICWVLSSEIGSLAEQAEEARLEGISDLNYTSRMNERKKALVDESRAASVYRGRIWRPWRKIRHR